MSVEHPGEIGSQAVTEGIRLNIWKGNLARSRWLTRFQNMHMTSSLIPNLVATISIQAR